jgi:hypothetical protein
MVLCIEPQKIYSPRGCHGIAFLSTFRTTAHGLYLNAAKTENYTRKAVKFETYVDKSKKDQKVVRHDVLYTAVVSFLREKSSDVVQN